MISSAPSPLGLLGGDSSLILSFLSPGGHLGSSPRQPPGFSLQSNLWRSADKLNPDPQEGRHLGSVSFYTNGPMSLDFAQSLDPGKRIVCSSFPGASGFGVRPLLATGKCRKEQSSADALSEGLETVTRVREISENQEPAESGLWPQIREACWSRSGGREF